MLEGKVGAPHFTDLYGRIPIARHEHVAVLYRGHPAAFGLASFLLEGLQRGDFCYYLAPPECQKEMISRLRAGGADLAGHLKEGTLRIDSGPESYRELREKVQRIFEDAESAHAPAVRWLEEGLWPQAAGFPMAEFFEFDALLNYQVKHYPSVALCQYDLEGSAVRDLLCAIAVHRHLLVDDTLVRDNPFYIPAEKFVPRTPAERDRELVQAFREVGFDLHKLLAVLVGYGQLQRPGPREP